ncbi:hypothetical protein [Gracilibacillus sp. YIM 98692]|uniref:DUF7669 domain-containing protein n=1 Tax=Gracilibacillus sp. YIM 98692 TaxID=2663532 RepID=UPI0013D89D03|nr:hypothetical protein [Gracilibacillus sp. YIM 98692]
MGDKKRTSCEDEMLQVIKELVKEKGKINFTVQGVLDKMKRAGTTYKEYTMRTHLTSKCCVNISQHHQTVYNDYKRIELGYMH